ncbi:MAG: VWA domain-containing protein [Deltaproteobacteria bacterium]|nr:VWA domain-containing protein [Deltaproteobacteria bacterium]
MPPKPRKKPPTKRVFAPLPKNTFWIENDPYDRRVWEQLRADSPSLRELEEKGSMFLPHFGSLLQDIFSLLFKYNINYFPDQQVLPSALLNQKFLRGVHQGGQYPMLREQTLLNEAHAGLSTLILGDRLLALVREQKFLNQRDLRDLWDIQKQEEIVGEKMEEYDAADTIPEDELSEEGKKALQKAKGKMAGEVQGAEALLRHKTAQLKEDLKQIEGQASQRLQAEAIKVAQQLEDATEEAETWGNTIGTGQKSPPGQQLELGRRLAGNEKLKKLAKMVGRMKFHALALRKKVFERSSEELLEVEQGDALHRLLPHEMLSLHHPVLRKDFYRRFLDQELIQYSLRGVEEKGKGPMVVCLDGSSSMSGDKEIWSKAVALTLLEIARKQRRRFRSICFSSAETPLQVLEMNPRDRYEVETKTIMDLAEYFPGGGTDFQKPLDAALECLQQSQFKKGDIIFITDGECQVSPEWAENFREQKEKLGFSLFSILIDMGPAQLGTLKEFSDRITTIKQLTGDEAKDIFVSF